MPRYSAPRGLCRRSGDDRYHDDCPQCSKRAPLQLSEPRSVMASLGAEAILGVLVMSATKVHVWCVPRILCARFRRVHYHTRSRLATTSQPCPQRPCAAADCSAPPAPIAGGLPALQTSGLVTVYCTLKTSGDTSKALNVPATTTPSACAMCRCSACARMAVVADRSRLVLCATAHHVRLSQEIPGMCGSVGSRLGVEQCREIPHPCRLALFKALARAIAVKRT